MHGPEYVGNGIENAHSRQTRIDDQNIHFMFRFHFETPKEYRRSVEDASVLNFE